MGLEVLNSITIAKTGTKVCKFLRDGNVEKFVNFGKNNVAASKFGLQSIVKNYDSFEKVKKVCLTFSDNPMLGEVHVFGTPEKVKAIWNAVAQMANKESVMQFLKAMKNM